MNTEEDEEFKRIEREAAMRKAAVMVAITKREWVGLTDDERSNLWWKVIIRWGDPSHDDIDLMKAIEKLLKEKND